MEADWVQRLIHRLAEGHWVSGTALAAEQGISRAALAKRMNKLVQNYPDLNIESRHGRGYRIAGALDLLRDAELRPRPALAAIPGLEILDACESTNTWLATHPACPCVLAEYQTAGRGRRGRRWQASYGQNLILSLRHHYPAWPDHLPALSLVLGLALVRGLRALDIPAQIKWPNDIWLQGRKLGGLLVETRGEATAGCELIVGLGLNVQMRSHGAIDQAWTSLAQAGYSLRRADLAARCIEALQGALLNFTQRPLHAQLQDFSAWDALADQPVQLSDGEQIWVGESAGLSPTGALRLRTADGRIEEYVVGDLSLRPDASRVQGGAADSAI